MPTPQEELDREYLQAACDGDAQRVTEALAAGATLMATTPNNAGNATGDAALDAAWGAMNYAIFCGATDVIAALAQAGYPLNGTTPQRPETPLNFALRMPTHRPVVIKELIRLGADINGVDSFGYDALCIALKRIDRRGITLLMEMGADPGRAQKMLDEHRGGASVKDHFALQAQLQLKREGESCSQVAAQGTALPVVPLRPLQLRPRAA
ncbi:MAG: hypothetical protein ACAH80_00145 [Alphaproteobacteria bacterium]